jgi:predicted kinase
MNKEQEIIIMVGISGSGKSTWALNKVATSEI